MKVESNLAFMTSGILIALVATLSAQPQNLSKRLGYLATNLLVDENVSRDIAMLERAHKAGYNGVAVNDSKFLRWDSLPDHYKQNCLKLRNRAKSLGMEFIAGVCPIGYSNDLLSRDVNLAEGLPVVDSPFKATQDGRLVPFEDSPKVINGGFEESTGDNPKGWGFVDEPGKISFIDRADFAEGRASLRMENIGKFDPQNGHGRAMQKIKTVPFHYYHVSVQVKTKEFETVGGLQILALGRGGRSLQQANLAVKRTMPWKKIDVTFNSLDSEEVNLYLGVWGGKGGTIWWDDLRIEPGGLVNLVRRPGAPFKVRSADGSAVFVEGVDYERASDPKMGNAQWPGDYDVWHEQPVWKLPVGSKIHPGQTVLVSYCCTALIYDGQAMCCLGEPKVDEILAWQISEIQKNLQPDGYFLQHDEIRMTGWDASCTRTGKTPGQVLADNVKKCITMIRKRDPGKAIYVWSDMFDPYHNAQATGPYYLVKGDGPWKGSWEGLDDKVIVVNWNSATDTRKKSMRFFSDRGNAQILAGYYDGPVNSIKDWLADSSGIKSINGVMYTTWIGSYSDLEQFMNAFQAKK